MVSLLIPSIIVIMTITIMTIIITTDRSDLGVRELMVPGTNRH